jgi:hypothetical protein
MTDLTGMGRLVSKDERDHNHLMTRRRDAGPITQRYWSSAGVLDQGAKPECVGFSGHKWLTSFPIKNIPSFSPSELYKAAQANDEWPGDDYEGSSVRGCFKALKDLGYVNEYKWAFDIEPVIDHLLTVGPVVVGTSWIEGMFMADDAGYIDDIGGNVVGGHAYLLIGCNRTRKTPSGKRGAFRILNSWGEGWEDRGRAWISFEAMQQLLANDGEACTATELKK